MIKINEIPIMIANFILIINIFLWGDFSSTNSIITISVIMLVSTYLNILVFNVFSIRKFLIKMGSTFKNDDEVKHSILLCIRNIKWVYIITVLTMFVLGALIEI